MVRRFAAVSALAALITPNLAAAQFGSIFRDAVRGARTPSPAPTPTPSSGTAAVKDARCEQAGNASRRSSVMGSVLGGIANRAAGRAVGNIGLGFYLPLPAFSTVLTAAFACKLDPKEQKQAADATAVATRSGQVGASSAWTSDARPDVTGSSTVAGKERLADGTTCMSVRDVAIVGGEETTVTKRMCRAPGASGYTLAA